MIELVKRVANVDTLLTVIKSNIYQNIHGVFVFPLFFLFYALEIVEDLWYNHTMDICEQQFQRCDAI